MVWDVSRCFGMFRSFSHNLHVVATVQASLLQTGRLISSSCTGVYTAECAAAMVEKTINTSKLLDFDVNWQSLSCFEPCLTKTFSICVILFHLVSCTMHNILCIILYYIIYINYIIFWIVYIYIHPDVKSQSVYVIVFLCFSWSQAKEIDRHCQQEILNQHKWINEWSSKVWCLPHIYGDITWQVAEHDLPDTGTFWERVKHLEGKPLTGAQYLCCHLM